jgi:hypothetical protein
MVDLTDVTLDMGESAKFNERPSVYRGAVTTLGLLFHHEICTMFECPIAF